MGLNDEVGHGTGCILSFDSRNGDFPVAAMLDPSAALQDKVWPLTFGRINQGNSPKCCGASTGQELSAEPVPVRITHPWTMDNLYNLAQTLDEWPGEGYAGTSLNAVLKAARQYGYITEWRWAANVDEVAAALSQLGPVLLAGPWLTGMFTPDAEGRVRVEGTAGNIGHCYMLGESRVSRGDSVIEQTWGPNWSRLPGPDGGWRGLLAFTDIDRLMKMGTQAAIITGRANPDEPVTPPAPTTVNDAARLALPTRRKVLPRRTRP